MKKTDATEYLDPTKYLESIFPTMPVWIQQCDDYKLVWKVQDSLILIFFAQKYMLNGLQNILIVLRYFSVHDEKNLQINVTWIYRSILRNICSSFLAYQV